jgi:hypothetical protein
LGRLAVFFLGIIETTDMTEKSSSDSRMPVFISWSGRQSKQLAIALHSFLSVVVQHCAPWMSDRDIGAGQTWDVEIEAALKRARFGVVCLTPSNVASTYLHYEAGAIANQVASVNRVCPLLLGFNHPSQLGQPLGRFQAKLATRGGVWDLVAAINRAVERPLDETVLRGAFEGQWDKLAADINRIQSPAELREPQRRSTDDILNEILEHVRQLVAGQLGTVQRDVLRAIKDANPRHLLFALDALGPDVRRAL